MALSGRRRLGPGPAAASGRRPLAVLAAAGFICCSLGLGSGALGFVGAPDSSLASSRIRRRAAGFSYDGRKKTAGKGKGFTGKGAGEDKKSNEKQDQEKKSSALAKDESERKSKELARTKLQDMRLKTLAKREKREAELDEYEEGRALIAKYGPKVQMMPEKVVQRTAKRGMVIGSAFYGMMLLVFAFAIAIFKTQDIIIPPTLVAFITLGLLALAVFGSSYGMMSAQWDPDKEQSVLGVEEFGENVKRIGEGFRKASMQKELEEGIDQRRQKRKLLAYKEEKKRELLNK